MGKVWCPVGCRVSQNQSDLIVVNTLFLGMIAGLTAAFFSSVSYLVARHHGTRQKHMSRRLLIFAHAIMGVICAVTVLSIFFKDGIVFDIWRWSIWYPCLKSTATYFVGTSVIFRVLRTSDASRISPLLGLKIIALAFIVSFIYGVTLGFAQWFAVSLCAAAAILLQRGGSGLPARSLVLLSCGCICFATADLGIVEMIDAIQQSLPLDRFSAGCLALLLTYILGGIVVLPFVFFEYAWQPAPTWQDWIAAVQYSSAWLLAMFGLYACIGCVGVMLSTILQSTRGIMSVILGTVVARHGWNKLEGPVDHSILLKRLLAAAFMTIAISIYVIANSNR